MPRLSGSVPLYDDFDPDELTHGSPFGVAPQRAIKMPDRSNQLPLIAVLILVLAFVVLWSFVNAVNNSTESVVGTVPTEEPATPVPSPPPETA